MKEDKSKIFPENKEPKRRVISKSKITETIELSNQTSKVYQAKMITENLVRKVILSTAMVETNYQNK